MTQKAAKEAHNSYYDQRDAKAAVKTREVLQELPKFVEQFLGNKAVKTTALTRKAYVFDLRIFLQFLKDNNYVDVENLKDMTPDMLSSLTLLDFDSFSLYLADTLKNENEAIKRKLCAVRALYTFLFKSQLIDKDISKLIEMPKLEKKAVVYIDRDDLNKLFDAVNAGSGLTKRQIAYNENFRRRDIAIVSVLIGTGIRESELVGLDFTDFNRNAGVIRVVRKGHKEAFINLPSITLDALTEYIDKDRNRIQALPGNENAIFLSSQRKRLSARGLQELIKKYVNAAALFNASSLSVHKLRATYATALLNESDGNLLLVSRNLGHEEIQTTTRYAAVNKNNSQLAASKMDKVLRIGVNRKGPTPVSDGQSGET